MQYRTSFRSTWEEHIIQEVRRELPFESTSAAEIANLMQSIQ